LKTKSGEALKIVSIGPAYPLRGGISKFNESLSIALLEEGVNVLNISFTYLYPGFMFPGKSQYSISSSPSKLKIHSWISPLNPFTWVKSAEKAKQFDPDCIVFHYWMPFFAPVFATIAWLIKRKKRSIRIFVIAHNLIPHEHQPGSRFLSRFLLKNVDGVLTLSSSVLNDLKILNPGKKGIFLPHPIYDFGAHIERNVAIEHLGLNANEKHLLFFGLVRDYKGLDLLIESLPLINTSHYKLLVVGEFYDKKERYLQLIDQLGMNSRVIIRDQYIPDDEVKYYFSLADLVVQPYKSATQSGITQIAYHFECPMVVTDVGGLPEIVHHNKTGYVVAPKPEKIAQAIDDFFQRNPIDFITNIKTEKEKYSWKNFVSNFINFTKSF
jgi:D-inositol-3-phosphate glycosyltransferase